MSALIRLLVLSVCLALIQESSVLASAVLPSPTPLSTVAPSTENPKRLNNLKTRGGAEIDRRLDRLQKVSDNAQGMKKLPPEMIKKLQDKLKSEKDSLTILKSSLSGDTDLASARQDVQKIIKDYPLYALVTPAARLVSSVDRLYAADEDLQLLRAQLQRKINLARDKGKDVDSLQKSLNSMMSRLSMAEPKYKGLAEKFIDINSSDYAHTYQAISDASAQLKTVRIELGAAEDDAKVILSELGNLKDAKASPGSKNP